MKDTDILTRAYDDSAGVTAAFNLNLLQRINRELDGDIPLDAFKHRAIWNDTWSRIEMHLAATRDVSFMIAGRHFEMGADETIDFSQEDPVAAIKEITDGVGADSVLECVGTDQAMQTAFAIARPGSTVGFVGVPHGVELPVGQLATRALERRNREGAL